MNTSATVGRIRSYDFGGHSDEALRRIVSRYRRDPAALGTGCLLPIVYAVVNEAIRRRLGIWRTFDRDFSLPMLAGHDSAAQEIVERGTYKSNPAYYTNEQYLEGPAFRRAVDSDPAMTGLDADDRAIIHGIVHVSEKAQRTESSNVMLPGALYRALNRRGIAGETQFTPTDEQLKAACLLFDGSIVEMAAGEGKTVAAAFPAVLHAVLGSSVHVVTANDYLASRDAEFLAPVYESLGLSLRAVLAPMNDMERAYAYRGDIVYATLRELGFDFLRDNLKHSEEAMVQGPLDVAIVDEADQAMIDEAHTPIIISGAGRRRTRHVLGVRSAISGVAEAQKKAVSALSRRMEEDPNDITSAAALYLADPWDEALTERMAADPALSGRIRALAADRSEDDVGDGLLYVVDARVETVSLTALGRDRVEDALGSVFDTADLERRLDLLQHRRDLSLSHARSMSGKLTRQLSARYDLLDQVNRALHAEVLLRRDVDYVVSDSKVVLVDRVTGRRRPDSRYQHGLQAAVEAKEGVPVVEDADPLAQIPVQGLFAQYGTLSGLTGTAASAAEDFRLLYGLNVAVVPPSLPSHRIDHPLRLYRSAEEKDRSLVEQVAACRRAGRPVLVGASTVEQAGEISALLTEHAIPHNRLDANSLDDEERVVAGAGRFGAVTVAANVAGRGTDILLEPGLDDRISQRYLSIIDGRLAEGYRTVSLTCGTPAELRLLCNALDSRPDLAREVDTCGLVASVSHASHTPGDASLGETRLEAGFGLHVIGAELGHDSRIDLQLRGRSGRQGQPGSTRFVLSLQDRPLASSARAGETAGRESHRDTAGNVYYEGPRTSHGVRRAQVASEMDDHAALKARADLNRILERHTAAYYRSRRQVMRSPDFTSECLTLAADCAARIVDRHLTPGLPASYEARFDRMSETLWLDYRIDAGPLWGLGPEEATESLSGLMRQPLLDHSHSMPFRLFEEQAKRLMLATSDSMWSEHLARIDGLVAGIQAAALGHTEAASQFGRRSVEAYQAFAEEAADRFVREMLTGGLSEAGAPPAPEVKLVEDAEQILV